MAASCSRGREILLRLDLGRGAAITTRCKHRRRAASSACRWTQLDEFRRAGRAARRAHRRPARAPGLRHPRRRRTGATSTRSSRAWPKHRQRRVARHRRRPAVPARRTRRRSISARSADGAGRGQGRVSALRVVARAGPLPRRRRRRAADARDAGQAQGRRALRRHRRRHELADPPGAVRGLARDR